MPRPNRSQTCPRALLRRLVDDTRGGILAFSVVLLLFVLGTGGLILDFSRVWNSQSELQAFADHAALVAAGELDGTPDAITRANNALAQLISDRQAYASQDVTLDATDLQATFLRNLPAADTDDDFSPFVTADPALAQYVRVVVNPHTVSTIFANLLLAVSGNAQVDLDVGAAAVAGYTQFVCDISPLMFCSPAGMDRETLRSWLPGRQIRLKAQNFWGPGAFGLLDVNFDENGPCGSPNQGANFFRCAVAVERSITRCFSRRGVDVRPGQAAGPSESGLNTRFDIYTTSLKSKRNEPDFVPAPNVIKGHKPSGGGGCINNNPEPSNVAELPQAQCLLSESCSGPSARFSSSQTVDEGQRQDYVQQNYTDVGMADKTGGANTRYQMYRNEIANSGSGDILDTAAGLEESGRASCASNMSADPDRRVLVAAAVDCSSLPPGNASNVPVLDFYRIFMTNIAGEPDPTDVWVEVIEHVDPFSAGEPGSGFAHDFVQLYR
ncbi:MAG TPA: pilus assembly protein TadG-related protein [Geminicoccaceae bacterium]|nr:pilus assembly protein TadG-related protein [Geminicoccaceae bacterium]